MQETQLKLEKNVDLEVNINSNKDNKLSNEIRVEDLMFGRNQPSSFRCRC